MLQSLYRRRLHIVQSLGSWVMPRWEPDASERLRAAAIELFAEVGFERTTVAEISRRAGLTQRSFFNHYSDKREVLFGLSAQYQQVVVDEIAARADGARPLDSVVGALGVAAGLLFEGRRDEIARRQAIIAANPELQEREMRKGALLTDAVASALQARGVEEEAASLAASAGMLVQQSALRRWLEPGERRTLGECLVHALASLRASIEP